MFRTKSFLMFSLATMMMMMILMLSVPTSVESLITQYQHIQAQSETNSNSSSISNSTQRPSDNSSTAPVSDIPFNTLSKMINSVCNITASNEEDGLFDGNESLTYLNPYYGVIIQYPPDWSYKEPESSSQDSKTFSIVNFSPSLSTDPNAETNLKLWVEGLDDPEISLDDYAKNVIRSYRESSSNFSLISGTSTNNTISNGSPAYEIIFNDYSNNLQRKSVEIGTLSNVSNSAYYITFNTDASLYSKFNPLINKMVDSFELFDYHSSPLEDNSGIYIQGYNDGLELMIPPHCLTSVRGNVTAGNEI